MYSQLKTDFFNMAYYSYGILQLHLSDSDAGLDDIRKIPRM